MEGSVEHIHIAPQGSADMRRVDQVEAVANRGLRDDRYFKETGYWSNTDVCEVTLIEGEALDTIQEEFDINLKNGNHRRNITTLGVSLEDLLNQRFKIGEAVLEGTRPRPPCSHVESLNEPGTARALKKHGGGGICANVVKTGWIHVGDSIEVL